MKDKLPEQSVWVVIPASGVGSRMKSDIPKQYILVHGKSILEHTVSRFASIDAVSGVLIVVSESDKYWERIKPALIEKCLSKGVLLMSTIGGSERSETVLKGLAHLLCDQSLNPKQWVMVHDAARPCVSAKDIRSLLAVRSTIDEGGAILATPVRDTLKLSCTKENFILSTQSRESLWQAQTPQLFRLNALLISLQQAKQAGITITDEASAMEINNLPVQLVEGSSDNIKLTAPSDLKIIEFLLNERSRE